MTVSLVVETEDFTAAAARLRDDVADPVGSAVLAVRSVLLGCGGMAGSDAAARAWGGAYDRAVAAALTAGVGVANGCYQVAGMFAQTARNYDTADAASAHRHRGWLPPLPALPAPTRLDVGGMPPPAAGAGPVDWPGHWSVVAHFLDHAWPNGHQDRLRHAADAWTVAGNSVAAVAAAPSANALALSMDRLPESGDVMTVCSALTGHIADLADAYLALADCCRQLAQHIDATRSAIENELGSLVKQSVAIQVVGGLLSTVTFGAAEVPTQGIEASRIAAIAARVNAILDSFAAAAATLTATIAAKAERLDYLAAEARGLYNTRLSTAIVNHVPAAPRIVHTSENLAILRLQTRITEISELKTTAEAAPGYVNVASRQRTEHILDSDKKGGGHLWPGAPGKTPFPKDWSGAKIMHEASDIATDPQAILVSETGGRMTLCGTRDRVEIYVVVNYKKNEIVTAFPTNLPRNPYHV